MQQAVALQHSREPCPTVMSDDEIAREIETFRANESFYRSTKDEIDKFSETVAKRGIRHIWESRVKTIDSLEGKLRKRQKEGKKGLSGIADLIGGRIVLLKSKDSMSVTALIKENFRLEEDPIQHPTPQEHGTRVGERFRGYDGLHFRLRLEGERGQEVVVEVQVVHIIMWMYYAVEHDLGYKGDQNSKELDRALEILKGATNLTTEAFEQFEEVLGKQKLLEGQTRVTSSCVQSTNLSSEERVASQIQNLLDPENQELLSKLLQAHATNAVRVSQIASIVPILHDSLKKNERQALFRWLSKMQPKQNHKTIGKDFMTGSGKWLLEKPSFNEWREGKKSSILWLHGIPGSGKTKLVYSVIERFSNGNENDLAAGPLAFFYCTRNASEPERADPDEIMRSILKQLCCTKVVTPVREPLASKYKELKEESDDDGVEEPPKLTCDECVDLIISLLESIPATIILDALDECDPDRRHELLLACDKIIQRSVNVVRIFVSSRDDGDIVCRLEKSPNVYIKTEDNHKDIKRFVLSEVGQSIAKKRLLAGIITEGLRKRIVDTLVEKSQGMFRWVSLQIQNLCDSQRIKHEIDVVEELGKLPRTLKESYEITFQRIQEAPTTSCRVAKLAMTWLLCAHTPLNTQEFITAVSVDTNATDPTGLYITLSPSQLLNMCRNMIVLDEETDMFRFAHLSVQEYLQERKDFGESATSAIALEICILVNHIELQEYPRSTTSLSNMQFKNYAIITWPIHCQAVGEEIGPRARDLVMVFLSLRYAAWRSALRMLRSTPGGKLVFPDMNLITSTPLYVVFRFGLHWILQELKIFESWWNIESKRSEGPPLHIAAHYGQSKIIQLVLQQKDLEKRNLGKLLWWALSAGNSDIAKLLLHEDIDVNFKGDDYRTPLSIAIQSWDSEIIVLLLQKQNIDASLKEFGAGIALVIACEKEESKIVALLVQFEGIDVNARAGRGGTPLLIACQSENLEIITSLLQVKSIDINARDKRGRTSLFIACEKGTVKAVSLLLQFNVIDINAEDGRSRTPLSIACENENLEIITLLLQAKSIDVNAGGPLSIACDHGNQEIIKLLLRQKDIDINSSDSAGPVGTGTPLEIACKYGNMELVTLLLESRDIDVNAGTPLYAACQNGNLEIVTLLLQAKDVNINGKGLAKIPLASACEQNNLEIVKLLLENKDIDINARDHKDRTPLIIACEVGSLEIVTMLLQNTEVDVNAVPQVWARQQFDAVWVSPTSTALVTACGSGNMEIIQLLLRHKDIKVNTGDLTGDTALLKAARMGNLEIAILLLDTEGIDINCENYAEENALHLAPPKSEVYNTILSRGGTVKKPSSLFVPRPYKESKDFKEVKGFKDVFVSKDLKKHRRAPSTAS